MLHLEADYFYEKRSNMLMAPNSEVSAEYGIPLSQVNPDGSLKSGIATQPWGQVYPGDLRYEDLSGPDGKIDENDMTVIGRSNWNPEVIFGLAPTVRWKGFDLDALFQGAARTNISLGETLVMPFFDSGSATKLQFKDHWTPANQNARYPRLTSEVTVNNHRQSSSWWVRDATYLRLKSIEIGYSLPRKAQDFLHISQLRVYVSGQNLWTWTPFIKELVDPEAGSANGKYYMQQAVYSFGLNITF